jgi:hypothetical protein
MTSDPLDHALRQGDSLIGLTKQQIASFTWESGSNLQKQIWARWIEPRVDAALAARREILDAGDLQNTDTKRQRLALADAQLDLVRVIGELAVAAFFAADRDGQRRDTRSEYLERLESFLTRRFREGTSADLATLTERPDDLLALLQAGDQTATPFHWEVEFAEVFAGDNPGFDAFVGNPPFMAKNTIARLGSRYGAFLAASYPGSNGKSDAVAFFFRRAFDLLRSGGTFGLVATNTIAQGDTRATGLRWICTHNGTVFAARRRVPWPGQAAVSVSVVHIQKDARPNRVVLDGAEVPAISAYLSPGTSHEDPYSLRANAGRAFQGCNPNGQGFFFEDGNPAATTIEEMNTLITHAPHCAERILPFMGGEELNTSPTLAPTRYIIAFGRRSEAECRQRWPELLAIVEAKVRPFRERGTQHELAQYGRSHWWQWHTDRPTFEAAAQQMLRVIAQSAVTSHLAFALLPRDRVFAHTLNVFAFDSDCAFAVLQSRVHECWARFFSSSLEERLRYTPSDCFETFPFPEGWATNSQLGDIGNKYNAIRSTSVTGN